MIFPPPSPADLFFDLPALRGALGAVIGLILGSFTTMLSYRLPRGLSIVTPPSRCPSCQTRLSPRDLVPVFSWLAHKGRCRHCGAAIGLRYLIIEMGVGAACAATFVFFGESLWTLCATTLIIVAVTTALTMALEQKPQR